MQRPEPYKILVVDDEVELAESIATYARRRLDGATVDIANSGNEAALRFQEHGPYDIVLSDVRMPNGDGVFLLNYISSLQLDTKPTFYFLTGFSETDHQTLLKKGADGVLEKPMSLKDLVKIFESALAAKKSA